MNIACEVADAMTRAGIQPVDWRDIHIDGTLCRFDCEGDHHGKRNAWAVVFPDGPRPVAVFGHWARGIKETFVLGGDQRLTDMEREQARMAMEHARRRREAQVAYQHREAQRDASRIWRGAEPASPAHGYLMRKHVQPHGLRQSGLMLLVPMLNADGQLVNLQRINPAGRKRFLRGGVCKDTFHRIGEGSGHIIIAEGYATAASLHEATGLDVYVAFSAGNLGGVAGILRRRYPDARITVACDNDAGNERGNIGVDAGKAAARAVGGDVAIPPEPGDFNDYLNGGHAITDAIREEPKHEHSTY